MGSQIIKQPDGRFAIFSSITDTIVMYDASHSDVLEYYEQRAAQQAREQATRLVDLVDAGKASEAYYQFAMTWPEALQADRAHDGEAWQTFAAGAAQPEETTDG
jgi:ERCC4-related helicase